MDYPVLPKETPEESQARMVRLTDWIHENTPYEAAPWKSLDETAKKAIQKQCAMKLYAEGVMSADVVIRRVSALREA